MTSSVLSPKVQDEISRIAKNRQVDVFYLEQLAYLILETAEKRDRDREKPLTVGELKQAVYAHFEAGNTNDLKKSGSFRMGTDGMEELDFRYFIGHWLASQTMLQ